MSIKSLLQIILFLLIVLIIGSIYFVYFNQKSFQININDNQELSKIENRNINEKNVQMRDFEEINEKKLQIVQLIKMKLKANRLKNIFIKKQITLKN